MNTIDIDNEGGRSVARVTLIITLLLSVIANITHACLADSEISLWLRVPGAAVWPVLSFLAIEVIVRITWARSAAHYLARTFILGPAIPAVIVSYEHQQRLLAMMGERPLVQNIGPLAIDGLMIGCTLALLFTRPIPKTIASEVVTPLEIETPLPWEVEPDPEATPESVKAPARERGQGDVRKAVAALQDGSDTAEAARVGGISLPTARRYASVVRTLRLDPHATIDARQRSVREDLVNEIRGWARRESVR